jgi:hypothetical protein
MKKIINESFLFIIKSIPLKLYIFKKFSNLQLS